MPDQDTSAAARRPSSVLAGLLLAGTMWAPACERSFGPVGSNDAGLTVVTNARISSASPRPDRVTAYRPRGIEPPPVARSTPPPPIEPQLSLQPALPEPSTIPPSERALAGTRNHAPSEVPHEPGAFAMLGAVVAPGSQERLTWTPTETYTGATLPTPVLVANGETPGATLCLTAAVHGDELNGIEIIRRLMQDLKPARLTGTLVGVPIVNLQAFQRHSRYLPDRRDLNRHFPGNPKGSSASRIAHALFRDIVSRCDRLVDLHTGSFQRINLPQLRADLTRPDVLAFTKEFGATAVLHSVGAQGTLRRAAVERGIAAVTLEAGGPLKVEEDAVKHGVRALDTLLDKLGMYPRRSFWREPEPVYYSSSWVRADSGGILAAQVRLGKRVASGDVLGSVTDPITNRRTTIVAPYEGRVLGMAVNQFVMPGYATFHIGRTGPPADAAGRPVADASAPLTADVDRVADVDDVEADD